MNQQILQESLEYFKKSLKVYICKEFYRVFGSNWIDLALSPQNSDTIMTPKKSPNDWDLPILITLIHTHWDHVFSQNISQKFPKSLLTVIKFYRNSWAHQMQLTDRDIYRVLDLIQVVLEQLHLNYHIIDLRRKEMLAVMSRDIQNVQVNHSKSPCNGCNRQLLTQYMFMCPSCGVFGCMRCMNKWVAGRNYTCPKCRRVLAMEEIETFANVS